MKKTIINFIETNVDGCGSNANILIEVLGTDKLVKEKIEEVKNEILKYIATNNDWDTDYAISVGCKILTECGYTFNVINPDYEIKF